MCDADLLSVFCGITNPFIGSLFVLMHDYRHFLIPDIFNRTASLKKHTPINKTHCACNDSHSDFTNEM